MSIKHFLSLLVISSGIVFSSCQKTDGPQPEPITGIEKLKIPEGFTFETTKTVDLSIVFPETIILGENKSRINVLTAPLREGGVLLTSASVDADNETILKLQVPAELTQLYVETAAGGRIVFIGQDSNKDGVIVIDFGLELGLMPPPVVDGMKNIQNNSHVQMVHYKSAASLVNLISNGEFDDNSFGTMPDWPSPMTTDGKWYITSTLGTNHAKQHTQAGEKMIRITPSQARYGGVAQLVPANPGNLITFTADIRSSGNSNNIAWLFLIPRDASGNSIGYFSIQTNNTSNNWITRTVAATMPSGTVSVQVLLWSHIFGGTIDYDNVIVTGPVSDSDGDGVDDELDEYPNDSERAFNVYYPNSEDFGTLAFEDLWPGKGDYDFNDLVLDYQFKQVLNADNELVEFYMDYMVRAIGASLENGFGFEIPGVEPLNVKSISGQQLTESYINLEANGTESGQSTAVIILFDNAFSMMEAPSGSFGVNTMPDAPYIEPVLRQLIVEFENPVSTQLTGFAPYNPFLIVDKSRGREVHLPGKTPTDLHDPSLFGQWFDATNPVIGKYYQSEFNLPWAISIPKKFDYPIEKTDITSAYLKFGSWAESGGQLDADWYSNTNAGYRNENLIYQKP